MKFARHLTPMETIACILAMSALVIMAPAHAQDDSKWIRQSLRSQAKVNCEWFGNCAQHYRYERWRRNHSQYRWHAYYSDVERRERLHSGYLCTGRMISVVSTAHQTVEQAFEAGVQLWQARTQWEVGGQYMHPGFAARFRFRCSLTDPGDAMRDKLGNALDQAGRYMPFTKNWNARNSGEPVGLKRCYIEAEPCRDKLEERDEDDRGKRTREFRR